MPKYKVSLAFARLPDAGLVLFNENIVDHMTGNAAFTTPVVSMAGLTAAGTNFSSAIAAASVGGKVLTAIKNMARVELVNLLNQEAAYVQSLAGEDLAALLSSGFEATSKNRTRIILPKPVVERVENVQSTILGLRLPPVPTARAYLVQIRSGTGDWQDAGIYTYTRLILLQNLTPGTVYTIQVRAIGGLTGYSDWSDPVSHMAF